MNAQSLSETPKPFMDENFLLDSKPAQRLYHEYAAPMPIIDYHCHIPPEDIAKRNDAVAAQKRIAPTASGRKRPPCRAGATCGRRSASSAATTPSGMLMTKIARHEKISVR